MITISLLWSGATAKNWAPRADTLLQALTHQSETIAKENFAASQNFQDWCQQALPWTKSLINMLEQQRLETENMESQVESNIARMSASKILDKVAIDTRNRLAYLTNTTLAASNKSGFHLQKIIEKAKGALDDADGDRFDDVIKQLNIVEQGEDQALSDKNVLQQRFLLHNKLTDKAQKVEMRNIEVQLAERMRTQARYQSEVGDLKLIEQVARNSSKVLGSTCHRQKQNGEELQSTLQQVIEESRVVQVQSNPMAAVFNPSFIQLAQIDSAIKVKEQKNVVASHFTPEVVEKDLLNDIDDLTKEEKDEETFMLVGGHNSMVAKNEDEISKAKVAELDEWCVHSHAKSEHSLVAQESDLHHIKARMKVAVTNGNLLKEQLDYFTAKRKEIDTLLKNLQNIALPQDHQADLNTFTRQTLSLSTSAVSSSVAQQLHQLVDNLGHSKYSLGLRGNLWKTWKNDLQLALSMIDHRLGSVYIHYQDRQQQAETESAFLESVQNYAVKDLELQKTYHHILKEACKK